MPGTSPVEHVEKFTCSGEFVAFSRVVPDRPVAMI